MWVTQIERTRRRVNFNRRRTRSIVRLQRDKLSKNPETLVPAARTLERVTPFRLALRVEGDKWNAYLAKPDTMQDAMWIGSILLKFVENNEHRKQTFIALMRDETRLPKLSRS
jgi:hypothetical protein